MDAQGWIMLASMQLEKKKMAQWETFLSPPLSISLSHFLSHTCAGKKGEEEPILREILLKYPERKKEEREAKENDMMRNIPVSSCMDLDTIIMILWYLIDHYMAWDSGVSLGAAPSRRGFLHLLLNTLDHLVGGRAPPPIRHLFPLVRQTDSPLGPLGQQHIIIHLSFSKHVFAIKTRRSWTYVDFCKLRCN